MYTYLHPLDNYRLIKALISSSDSLTVANDLPIEEITAAHKSKNASYAVETAASKANIPSAQEGVSRTSIEDPTYDVAAGWTAVADHDGDGSRGRRGTVVGDQVHLLVLLLHVRLHLHNASSY